jgi:excisionase family DNA binding protein
MVRRWLKMSEACRYASLSRKTVKVMLMDGSLTGERTPGGHWRVDKESIDSWFGNVQEKAVAIVRSLHL